jgi:hypothetical protein
MKATTMSHAVIESLSLLRKPLPNCLTADVADYCARLERVASKECDGGMTRGTKVSAKRVVGSVCPFDRLKAVE